MTKRTMPDEIGVLRFFEIGRRHQEMIHAERDRKLEEARKQRQIRRRQAA